MPHACALAICTTFCSHIAGALIPLFGADFPSKCVDPEAPEHGRMIIERQVIVDATIEAENYRKLYNSLTPRSTPRSSMSPQLAGAKNNWSPDTDIGRKLKLKRAFRGGSPYSSATDKSSDASGDEHGNSRVRSTVWSAINKAMSTPNTSAPAMSSNSPISNNPWLSAIPKVGALPRALNTTNVSASKGAVKRRAPDSDIEDDDHDHASKLQAIGREAAATDAFQVACSSVEDVTGNLEKRAAYLLLELSMGDSRRKKSVSAAHRHKRMRAASA